MSFGVALLLSALAAPAPPATPPAFFAAHREKLAAKLPAGAIAVLRSAPASSVEQRADPYRQDSDFWYVTGLEEPDAVAVLQPSSGGAARFLLFVPARDFANEQWTGWRAGTEGARALGANEASIGDFWTLSALAAERRPLLRHRRRRGVRPEDPRGLNAGNANAAAPRPAPRVAPPRRLRLVKDAPSSTSCARRRSFRRRPPRR
jgi:hypothetical protein